MLEVKELQGYRAFRVGSFLFAVCQERNHVLVTSWDWKEMNGENAWWNHGCPTIWHFITGTDPQYVMKKFFDYSVGLHEIDEDATRKAMIRYAKEYPLNISQSDEFMDALEHCSTPDDFARVPHIENAYELICYKEKFCCEEFRKAWPLFCAYIKENILPGLPPKETA